MGAVERELVVNKNTPPRDGVYACAVLISQDGKSQPTPKRWKQLHVENLGDRPHKRRRHQLQGSDVDKSLRDGASDGWTSKRLASD